MEETITLSQVADLIIVMGFAVTVLTFFINALAELTFNLIESIKRSAESAGKRKPRRLKKRLNKRRRQRSHPAAFFGGSHENTQY